MRGLRAAVGVLLAVAGHLPVAWSADSRIRTWISPDQSAELSSVKIGNDDEPGYRLNLIRAGQPPVVVDEYYRSVDVLWSADSRYVAITDWIGSNVADCYIGETAKPENKVSVTSLLPEIREDVTNSHFYVSCRNWESPRPIAVRVTGHTDSDPSHQFAYQFVFDVITGRLVNP